MRGDVSVSPIELIGQEKDETTPRRPKDIDMQQKFSPYPSQMGMPILSMKSIISLGVAAPPTNP
jgi:hypothetical protein